MSTRIEWLDALTAVASIADKGTEFGSDTVDDMAIVLTNRDGDGVVIEGTTLDLLAIVARLQIQLHRMSR